MIDINKKIEIIKREIIKKTENRVNNTLADDYSWQTLKEMLEWFQLSPIDQQQKRISGLGILRKSGNDVTEQLKTINIFDKVTRALPYVIALNDFPEIENLCLKELEFLENGGRFFNGNHISQKEVIDSFDLYHKTTANYKSNMFKECYEVIDDLYIILYNI